MKKKDIFYRLAGLIALLAFTLQIMHVPYASVAITFAFVVGLFVQRWYARQLEEKLEEHGVHLHKNMVDGICLLLVVGTVTMKVLHFSISDFFISSPLVIGILVLSGYIRYLEKKLNKMSQT